jgi:recyclin-1
LLQARIISQDLFLQGTAATFVQAWKLVDVAMEVLGTEQTITPRTQIEDVIYRMFEVNMDEYLDEETEWVKTVLDGICRAWDQEVCTPYFVFLQTLI